MALDEALAEWSGQSGSAVLRFYAWQPATLSLGYFQPYAERLRHEPSRQVAVVRRASGGGAILHDDEVTYSLALPGEHALAEDTSWLYTAVHEALIDALAAGGVPARLAGASDFRSPGGEPFLCFLRRAAVDVVAGQEKICGSASAAAAGRCRNMAAWCLGDRRWRRKSAAWRITRPCGISRRS